MANFTLNMTGAVEVDNSKILEMSQALTITSANMGVADQFATVKEEINAKSISFDIYDPLAVNTTPLTDKDDVASVVPTVGAVSIEPKEYGAAVTKTSLASLQTGGKIDLAIPQLVGINMAQTQNRLACIAMDASSNVVLAGGAAALVNIDAAKVMTDTEAAYVYNRMSRKSIPGHPVAGNVYVMLAHEDVIHDMKKTTYWTETSKYADPNALLLNEVGMFKGFRVIKENLATMTPDAGAGAKVDVYNTYCFGWNAYGKATSLTPNGRLTGPFDKLARFANVGWYGVVEYKIVDQSALWVIKSASSVGVNV